jgi:hypothetical protein
MLWRWNSSDLFTTQSWLEFGTSDFPYSKAWATPIPLKINVFWLVQKNKILTKDNLIQRRWMDRT